MDAHVRQEVLRNFGYGLYVATTTDGTHRAGWAANWIMQCSFDPPLLTLAAGAGTARDRMIEAGGVFAVNLMDTSQLDLVTRFYRPVEETGDDLGGVPFTTGVTGCPLLEDALGFVECRVLERHAPGDHTVYTGTVVEAGLRREGVALTMRDVPVHYAG